MKLISKNGSNLLVGRKEAAGRSWNNADIVEKQPRFQSNQISKQRDSGHLKEDGRITEARD